MNTYTRSEVSLFNCCIFAIQEKLCLICVYTFICIFFFSFLEYCLYLYSLCIIPVRKSMCRQETDFGQNKCHLFLSEIFVSLKHSGTRILFIDFFTKRRRTKAIQIFKVQHSLLFLDSLCLGISLSSIRTLASLLGSL